MKKLWITLIVVVSILIVWGAFTLLGKVNNSSLSTTSQAIEKIQHNTETSDNLIEELLKSERHFVEASFITVSIIVTVVIILFSILFTVANFRISRSELERVKVELKTEYAKKEEKLRTEFTEQFNNLEISMITRSVDGFYIQALSFEKKRPEAALVLYKNILPLMIKYLGENKEVQERITRVLKRIPKLAPKITLTDEEKKSLKDILDEFSKHPFLKEKTKEIKEKLEIK